MTHLDGLRRSVLLGIATGIHSMTGMAFLSWSALQGRPDLAQSPLRVISKPEVAILILLAACAEVVADKFPFLPSRTAPAPLAGRIVIGALAGGVSHAYPNVDRPDGRRGRALLGAAAGASSTAVSAFALHSLRKLLTERFSVPQAVAGVVDSIVAILTARAAIRSRSAGRG
ncbi:MAG TPA: hypothetical protein VF898_13170 [Chloroflexota bacterium]